MLRAFVNAFKIPDLRGKILFTLLMIAVYRLGSHVPVPGVDIGRLQDLSSGQGGGFLSFIDLFSGGALTNMAIFALGIMPYITSSIIMQLLTVVIPKLEQWQKQGEVGIKKITQWTRYMTVTLALLQSTGLVFLFKTQFQIIPDEKFTAPRIALIVLTLTTGTALIMWMGEQITQRGIGNGMSILIFASVISTLPAEGAAILSQAGGVAFTLILALGLGLIFAVVFMEQGQRRIPVQYAKRVVGRRMTAGGSTYIPLKVNQAGVIPIIFASSVLYFPSLLASAVHWEWFQNLVNNHLASPRSPVYMVVYGLMVVFFAYFYTAISFNPVDTADNIRKYGGFIPGIRP
ncbi:MAG: preprotein translocase subunit SecY, partial [Actinobacteria bacterium]|nr:preprotein translocase subunit SecY [Actinomycetota bacterium]